MPKKPTKRAPKPRSLPDKASTLIRMAMKHLKSAERYPTKYRVDMAWWHQPQPNKTCAVCLAGAVMAREFREPLTAYRSPDSYNKDTARKLRALNYFRMGVLDSAYQELNRNLPDGVAARFDIPSYEDSRAGLYTAMARLANILEAAGD